jgi:fucose permease
LGILTKPTHDHPGRGITPLNFAAMFEHGLILLMVGSIVPEIKETFGIGESATGLLLSVGSLGFVVGPLVAGSVIDRVGVRFVLLAGFVIELAALLLFGTAQLFFVAAMANLVMHFGSAFIETSANVLPTLSVSRRSAHSLMNLVHMFFSIGAFVGPFLIGLYVGATGLWRPLMFLALIPAGVLLLWTMAVRFPAMRPQATHPLRHMGSVLKLRYVILGAVALFAYVGAEIGISSWVVYYLQEELALTPVVAKSGLSMLWIFIFVGRYLNSILGNRYSSRFLVTVSGFGGALGIVGFLLAGSLWSAYLLLAWIGLCMSGVFPNVMAELNNRDPSKTGTVTAVMATGAAIGAALFQWLIGLIAETLSLAVAFVLPAVLMGLVVVTFAAACRAGGRQVEQSA